MRAAPQTDEESLEQVYLEAQQRIPLEANVRTYKSKDGLIYEGERIVPAPEADRLARANNFLHAERLVQAFEGKEFTTNEEGIINEIAEDLF